MSMKKTKVTETTETTETTEKKAKLSVIAEAAAEINKVLTPEPLIDLAVGDEQLKKDLVELIPTVQPEDELSPATMKLLKELGWGKKAEKKIEKVETKPSKVVSDGKGGQKRVAGTEKKVSKVKADDGKKIIIDEKSAPTREGTKVFIKFTLYRKTKTVSAYLAAGGERKEISFDLYHKRITLS